jgi:hypothetical protein
MPLTPSKVEELAEWCMHSDVLAYVRSKARGDFFGYDEPVDAKYIANTGELNSRDRRMAGWFGFSFRMPDGRHPAEMAAVALLSSSEQAPALKSIQQCRFVMAMATTVIPGKGAYLKLEEEEFQVDSRALSQVLYKGDALCAHIMSIGRGKWLVCPGWLVWPFRLGPGVQSHLKKFQLDPIELERFLQQRASSLDERPKIEHPRDGNLEEAVARLTKAAQSEGKDSLVKSVEEWNAIVLADMKSSDITKFGRDLTKMVGSAKSIDDLNRWLGLAMNIWNNTPQPDRGGRTANEMGTEPRRSRSADESI